MVVNGKNVDLYAYSNPWGGPPSEPVVSGLQTTVAIIRLANPIEPNSIATLEIDWHTKLPGGENGRGHRMTQRWDDEVFQPTQWFPRIAKYDDLRGWYTDVYLGPAEFFNNFGRFDVKINVPAGWLVSGTGVLQNPKEVLSETVRERLAKVLDSDEEIMIVKEDEIGRATVEGDRLTWHFVADNVNDFAWASSADYLWRATRATIPEKGPVPIHMVYLPSRAQYFSQAGRITRHALEFYSELWAPYPFPQMTLQDGPSAGMEYPMVINSNQGAADHEVAHQWWPMMLGTNETRYGWMDEGFNQYMNILSRAHRQDNEPRIDGLGQRYGAISGNEDEPPLMWNANYGGPMYGFQTYSKTPLMLSMLGGIVGDEAVQEAMRGYTAAWSFKHPSPWDYIFFMNNALGQDLEWFWYYWLWTTESVEGSIQNVEQKGSRTIVTVHQAGQMPSPVILKVELEPGTRAIKASNNLEQIDENTVVYTWPADVWFDGQRTFEAELNLGGRKIKKITLDPNRRFPDKDTGDNEWINE